MLSVATKHLVFSNLLPGNDSFADIRCNENVISDALLSSGRLLWLHHSFMSEYKMDLNETVIKGASRIALSHPVADCYDDSNGSSNSIRCGEISGIVKRVFASE
jgi:hypothetical protein